MADAVHNLNELFRAGRAGVLTDDITNLTGTAPRTFRQWAEHTPTPSSMTRRCTGRLPRLAPNRVCEPPRRSVGCRTSPVRGHHDRLSAVDYDLRAGDE
jgi:hypothetical protein